MKGDWADLANQRIVDWELPKIDWAAQEGKESIYYRFSRHRDEIQRRMMETMLEPFHSAFIIDSLSARLGGICVKCSEGILKLDFLKESKDNYCTCLEGNKLRDRLKEKLNG
jgi:hypothetical protein